jgi:AcrR family transcriptional regulator
MQYDAAMSDALGLRERKKTETKAAIQQAVLLLALGRGLDAVTVDEIAAAANVSVRTFHNYFGSKEEALVAAWVSEFRVHIEALRDRPAGEPILDALEHVLGEIGSRIGERPGEAESHVDLLWTSTAMARYRSVLLDEAVRMVTDVVAARTGTDAATDMYPHLVTAAAISAMVTAYQFTPPGGTPVDRGALLEQAFALLRSGLRRGQAPPG